MRGAGGTPGGLGAFLAGLAMVVAGGYLLLILVLLAGGFGLLARSLRPQGAAAAGSYTAAE